MNAMSPLRSPLSVLALCAGAVLSAVAVPAQAMGQSGASALRATQEPAADSEVRELRARLHELQQQMAQLEQRVSQKAR